MPSRYIEPKAKNRSRVYYKIAELQAAQLEQGANALLTRVGAYYHDAGKMVRPYFFTENQVEELGKKSAKVLDRLFDAAQKLSGIGVDDVEALLGNSNKTTDDGSD